MAYRTIYPFIPNPPYSNYPVGSYTQTCGNCSLRQSNEAGIPVNVFTCSCQTTTGTYQNTSIRYTNSYYRSINLGNQNGNFYVNSF